MNFVSKIHRRRSAPAPNGARQSLISRAASVHAQARHEEDENTSQGLTAKVISSVAACSGAALADPLMSLVDTAFVGRLGVLPLAALGPNAALFNVVFFIGFSALGVVATNQISAAYGCGDHAAQGRGLIISCAVSFILGLAITAALMLFPEHALRMFQTNAEMMPYAKTYCVIRALGVTSALLMIVFQSAFRAVEDMRTPFLVVAASGALNAILDPLMIYTLGMGIAGAAWATSASQVAGAAIFAFIIHRKASLFGLPQAWATAKANLISTNAPFSAQTPPLPAYASPVSMSAAPPSAPAVGLPVGLRSVDTALALCRELPWPEFVSTSVKLAVRCVLVLSTWTLASAAATRLGTYSMAAYQIMQQVLQLQLSICWAFLAVGQSLVGVKIAQSRVQKDAEGSPGQGAKARWTPAQRAARVVGHRVVQFAVLASAVMAGVTWVLRGVIPRVFTDNAGVVSMVEGSVLLMCAMLALGWNNALEGVLMGADDTEFVINIYPVCVVAFIVMLGVAQLAGWGLQGIWGALVLYYVGLACCLSARFWVTHFRARI
eukprot:jgi/Ulvmu1/6068/UM027_0046.1